MTTRSTGEETRMFKVPAAPIAPRASGEDPQSPEAWQGYLRKLIAEREALKEVSIDVHAFSNRLEKQLDEVDHEITRATARHLEALRKEVR